MIPSRPTRRLLPALVGLALLAAAAPLGAQTPTYRASGEIALADGGWDLVSFDPVRRRLYIARPDSVTAGRSVRLVVVSPTAQLEGAR